MLIKIVGKRAYFPLNSAFKSFSTESFKGYNNTNFYANKQQTPANETGFYKNILNNSGSNQFRNAGADSSSGNNQEKSVKLITPFIEEELEYSISLTADNLSQSPFNENVAKILSEELEPQDVEIRPDGILYLPEIRYRNILMKAFGPGGWSLLPRGPHTVSGEFLSREYWLICHGKFVAVARGFGQVKGDLTDATEAAKSNALMRCCKDLGVAKDLWNPRYIKQWKESFARQLPSQDGRKPTWIKNITEE